MSIRKIDRLPGRYAGIMVLNMSSSHVATTASPSLKKSTFVNISEGFRCDDLALIVERIAQLQGCVDTLIKTEESVVYCHAHEEFHCVDFFNWAEAYAQLKALRSRARTLRKIENKLSNIIYHYLSKNSLSYLDNHAQKEHVFVRKHKYRFNLMYKYIKSKYYQYLEHLALKAKLNASRRILRQNAFMLYEHKDIICDSFNLDLSVENVRPQRGSNIKISLDYSNVSYNLSMPYEEVHKVQNVDLIGRYKEIMYLFKLSRSRGNIFNFTFVYAKARGYITHALHKFINCDINDMYSIRYVIPESDTPKDEKGPPVSNIEQGGNVVLTEEHPAAPSEPCVHYMPNFWQGVSSNDTKGSYSELTSRYIELASFVWSKDDGINKFLLDLDLPKALLTMDGRTVCDRPNTIPFKVNALAKYDLEIKVQINAQKFQIGQLMALWYYFPQFDAKFINRWQLTSESQTLHTLLTANVSNEGSLYIPYNYYAPYIRTRDRPDMPDANNMGKFILTVLNPLTVSSTGASKCYGTVWIRFVNAEFTGTVSGSFGAASGLSCIPESVFSNVMEGAVKGLMTSFSDTNRDNPPDPRAPMYIVPSASHSWAVGTGSREPNQPLRLDSRGQKPHLSDGIDEMDVRHIASKYAYVRTITVSKDDSAGKLLAQFEASPMMNKSQYWDIVSTDNELPAYYLPPCAVISNLFNYWRGSLNFRFDLVYSTVGHNARFLVAYIPGATTTSKVTLADAKSSPHVIITLGETQSYTYTIPFVSHRPFWSRNYTGNYDQEFVQPPSMVYLFLLNPLVPMESVPDKMYINLWMSAGDDFEVAVPVQPNIGLSFDRTVIYNSSELIQAIEGYYPYYPGNYYRVQNSKVLVMRHAATSGAASVFSKTFVDKTTSVKAYYYESYDEADMPSYKDNAGNMTKCRWGVIWPTGSINDWPLIVCESEEKAKALAILLAKHAKEKEYLQTVHAEVLNLCVQSTDTTSNTWSHGNPLWSVHEVLFSNVLVPESDDKNVVSTAEALRGTGFGLMMFGERFFSLKDLCRRYQMYSSFVIDASALNPGQCAVIVPVMLQGLDLNVGSRTVINEISNRCRDGHIPIVASGYRVGSGSVRFRLIVPVKFPIGIWVQHRPDRGLRSRASIPCREIITAEAVANHSYAAYIQLTNVNGIIEFEIPYYVPGPFVMLQQPYLTKTDDKYFYSLGEISIGFIFNKNAYNDLKQTTCTLYYSLGDDCRFSIFQGFPPMVLLDDISDVAIVCKPEGPVLGYCDEDDNQSTYSEESIFDIRRSVSDTESSRDPFYQDLTYWEKREIEREEKLVYKRRSHLSYPTLYPKVLNPFDEGDNDDDVVDSAASVVMALEKNVQPEGLLDSITGIFVDKASTTVIDRVEEKLTPLFDSAESKITELSEKVRNATGFDILNMPIIRQVVYILVHIAMNPTMKTILWSISTILVELGFMTLNYIQTFMTALKEFLLYIKSLFSSNEPNAEGESKPVVVMPQGPNGSEDNPAVGLLTVMWTGICGVVGYAGNKPKDFKSYAKFLTVDMKNVFQSGNSVFTLLSNLVDTFKRMYKWIVMRVYPNYEVWQTFSEQYEVVKAWCQEVVYLTDPERIDDVFTNSDMIDRIQLAFDQGSLFLMPLSDLMTSKDKDAMKIITTVREMYKRIAKLHADCIAMGVDSHIRKVCFTICMHGEPGVGKSYLMTETCRRLLSSVDYQFRGPMECAVDPTSKYWSQCARQPVLVMDDMWAVETGQILEQQIIMLNQLFSHVPFTPPMAELSDKKMRYNPEIYWYNTNKPFPTFDRVDSRMIYRRRHVLIKARSIDFSAEAKTGCAHCEKKWRPQDVPADYIHLLEDFHHLRFGIHKDIEDPNEHVECTLKYQDLLTVLMTRYHDHRKRETMRFESELKKYADMRDSMLYDDSETEFAVKVNKIKNLSATYKRRLNEVTIRDVVRQYWDMCGPAKITELMNSYTEFFKESMLSGAEYAKMVGMSVDAYLTECKKYIRGVQKVEPESPDKINPIMVGVTMKDAYHWEDLNYRTASHILKKIRTGRADIKEGLSNEDKGILDVLCELYERGNITGQMFDEGVLCLRIDDPANNKIFTRLILGVFCRYKDATLTYDPDPMAVREIIVNRRECKAQYTHWYDVFTFLDMGRIAENQRMGQRMFPYCVHWDFDVTDVSWNSTTKWVQRGVTFNDLECTSQWCPFKCFVLRRGFLDMFLKQNPEMMYFYRKNRLDMIPEEYTSVVGQFPDYKSFMYVVKTVMASIRSTFSAAFKRIGDFFRDYWPILLTIVPFLSFLGVCVWDVVTTSTAKKGLINKVSKWCPESGYSMNVGKAPSAVKAPAVPQGASQQYEIVIKLLQRNFFDLTLTFKGKIVKYRCLRLRKHELLILRHYDDEIRSVGREAVIYGRCGGLGSDVFLHGIPFNYYDCEIRWYNNVSTDGYYPSNLGILQLPPCFPMAKDITSFIATAEDHKYASGYGTIVEGEKIFENLRAVRDNKRPYVIPKTDIVTAVVLDDVYTYNKHGAGMCGSILLSSNMQRPILAVHVAGYTASGAGCGIAEILTSEMFVTSVHDMESPLQNLIMPELDDAKFANIDLETAIFPYGCVTGKFAQAQSGKTQYVPSPIQGVYPVEMEPNPLSKTDKRLPKNCDPLSKGIAHKGLPPMDFNDDLLNECAFDLERVILGSVKPQRATVGILPFEDAICGLPGLDGYDMIEMSTSPGYPLSAIKPPNGVGKKWLFDMEEKDGVWKLRGVHDELKRIYTLEMAMRKRGIKPFTVFADCLKDTCLPLEKCRVPGKTRIFSISPVQFTIAFKQYCLDFTAAYQKARFDAEHAIGINPQSLEWTELTGRLLKKSKYIVTGDYKNFGPGLMKKCVTKAKNIILSWYRQYGASLDHINILNIMFEEICDAFYLGGNLIYQTPCGIPSGSPITAPLNSLVNSLYIRYVYGCLVDRNFSKFGENVFVCTYGDDVIMSVVPEIIDRFNSRTMSRVFADYRIVFTDQDKSDCEIEYRDISTATFLKRDFIPHPKRSGVWIGRLEKRSIQNVLNWVHRKGNIIDNLRENASMAVQLAVEWGPEYYNDMCRRVNVALSDYGVQIQYNSWEYWDREHYSSS